MSDLFTRISFLVTEEEFRQITAYSRVKTKGTVSLTQDLLHFEAKDGGVIDIPMSDIASVHLAREPIQTWYWVLVLSVPLLLSVMFVWQYLLPGKWTTENLVLFPLAVILVIGFTYLPLFQRTWVKITTHSDQSIYFSFDWRVGIIADLPWTRQSNIWDWWTNRGDCKEVVKRITKYTGINGV